MGKKARKGRHGRKRCSPRNLDRVWKGPGRRRLRQERGLVHTPTMGNGAGTSRARVADTWLSLS